VIKPENLREKFFLPPKKFGGGKTSNFAELLLIRHQSEVRNFKVALNIDKEKPMRAKKRYQTWGHHPTGF